MLALAPDNSAAHRGIDAISDRYIGLAYRDLESNNFARAESYLNKAEALAPGRAAVGDARAALAAKRLAARTPTAAVTPAPSRVQQFGQRFKDFVREQKHAKHKRGGSRADQFLDRIGGSTSP